MLTNEQKKEKRTEALYCSDLPIIFCKSKFVDVYELALEKAGIKERIFKGSLYTEFGNIFEPKIQELMKITEDGKTLKKHLGDVSLIGHTDGKNEKGEITEIKAINSTIDEAKEQYFYQMLGYAYLTNVDFVNLILFNRGQNEEVKNKINEIKEKYFKSFEFKAEFTEENEEPLKKDLAESFANFKLLKKDIQTKKIYFKEKDFSELEEKCIIFWEFVQKLKDYKAFYSPEEIEENEELKKELYSILGQEIKFEDQEMEVLIKKEKKFLENEEINLFLENKKQIEEKKKDLKKELKIGTYKNSLFTIKYTESEKEAIDYKKIIEDLQKDLIIEDDVLEKYISKNTATKKTKTFTLKAN